MSDESVHKRLRFGSKHITYELSFRERKTLGIRVYPDCSVRVIAPLETTEEKITQKIRSKAPWILKQQNDFLSYHPLTPPRQYVNGETHLYLGRQYRLKIQSGPVNDVKLYRGRLLVTSTALSSPQKLLKKWYRDKARQYFAQTLSALLPLFRKYNIKEPVLHILDMPTRWGSCTPRGKIILNPELIKAPKGSIEYVIIHELCHLVHHNHTRAFYALQEKMMPDWRKWKGRLEKSIV